MTEQPRFGGFQPVVTKFVGELFDGSIHLKRLQSIADATLGVVAGASLAIPIIGHSLAQARGLVTKHATKQVDRLLSNNKFVVWDYFAYWALNVVADRKEIVVAMDWTDFDADGQTTLVLSIVTSHGRATPVLWLSVWKDELKGMRNNFEDACLVRLSEVLPNGVKVTILADRGFGYRAPSYKCADQRHHGSGLGAIRCVVEHANAWLLANKRLDRPNDHLGKIVDAHLITACNFMIANRLADL